jgi:type I restriction enzyme S subunit
MSELDLSSPITTELPDVRHFSIGSRWLNKEDNRLDATSYTKGAFLALDAIEACKAPKTTLGELCGTIWHPVQNQARTNFKRIYTGRDHGVPFVSSREMFFLPLRPDRFLSKKMPKLSDLMVPQGWLLLSRSGTVGNVLYVNAQLAACAISDHAIRIQPLKVEPGYLYAFLASSYGQVIVAKGIYGGTVDEIEPKHLATIPVPMPSEGVRKSIHTKVAKAYELRDEANTLFDQAEDRLHDILGVSPFSEKDIEYLGSAEDPRAFSVAIREVTARLDATSYVPIVRSALHKLKRGRCPLVRLGDTDTTVTRPPRFKRVYVRRGWGVPFFQPSHIRAFRPQRYKYLSRKASPAVLRECMLQEGTIVVTRSGTAGESTLVTKRMLGWAGSDDLIRVIPRTGFDAGFLAAYFATLFAKHQMLGQLYGGVVDHIDESHVEAVLCPLVPMDLQKSIGDLVRRAVEKRDAANDLEEEAVAEAEAVILNTKTHDIIDATIARQRLVGIREDPYSLISRNAAE